jgi:hypothetical protein
LFSLRPENIRLAGSETETDFVRVRGTIERQAFHGATDLLQIGCDDGLTLSVRTSTRENRQEEVLLEFSAADAFPVRESPDRG